MSGAVFTVMATRFMTRRRANSLRARRDPLTCVVTTSAASGYLFAAARRRLLEALLAEALAPAEEREAVRVA